MFCHIWWGNEVATTGCVGLGNKRAGITIPLTLPGFAGPLFTKARASDRSPSFVKRELEGVRAVDVLGLFVGMG